MEIPFITEVGRGTREYESSGDQVAGRTNQGCRPMMMSMFSPAIVKMKESLARVSDTHHTVSRADVISTWWQARQTLQEDSRHDNRYVETPGKSVLKPITSKELFPLSAPL